MRDDDYRFWSVVGGCVLIGLLTGLMVQPYMVLKFLADLRLARHGSY
jgi:hypothetical protein